MVRQRRMKHTNSHIYSYLSNIFHDKCPFLDFLHGLDSPAPAVGCSEDADFDLASQLNHTVWTLRTTLAALVALIDRGATGNSQPLPSVVCKLWPTRSSTARFLLIKAVLTLASNKRVLRNLNAFPCSIVVDVLKVFRRSFKVHIILYENRSGVSVDSIEFSFPFFQCLLDLCLLQLVDFFLGVRIVWGCRRKFGPHHTVMTGYQALVDNMPVVLHTIIVHRQQLQWGHIWRNGRAPQLMKNLIHLSALANLSTLCYLGHCALHRKFGVVLFIDSQIVSHKSWAS